MQDLEEDTRECTMQEKDTWNPQYFIDTLFRLPWRFFQLVSQLSCQHKNETHLQSSNRTRTDGRKGPKVNLAIHYMWIFGILIWPLNLWIAKKYEL